MSSEPPAAPYQLLPGLAADEYDALHADIAARGVQVAIEYDEAGNVLDGHHRLRICAELGISDFPHVIRSGLTEQQKTEHVLALNLARRHLTREQQRELHVRLAKEKGWSNRRIAATTNMSEATVRRDLATASDDAVALPSRTVGLDDKERPAQRPRKLADLDIGSTTRTLLEVQRRAPADVQAQYTRAVDRGDAATAAAIAREYAPTVAPPIAEPSRVRRVPISSDVRSAARTIRTQFSPEWVRELVALLTA